jgi:hypothetical protein
MIPLFTHASYNHDLTLASMSPSLFSSRWCGSWPGRSLTQGCRRSIPIAQDPVDALVEAEANDRVVRAPRGR